MPWFVLYGGNIGDIVSLVSFPVIKEVIMKGLRFHYDMVGGILYGIVGKKHVALYKVKRDDRGYAYLLGQAAKGFRYHVRWTASRAQYGEVKRVMNEWVEMISPATGKVWQNLVRVDDLRLLRDNEELEAIAYVEMVILPKLSEKEKEVLWQE